MNRLGTQLSHYRLLSLLGEGGMGSVYRAEDVRLGRQVALKLPAWGSTVDAEARQQFLAEARAIAALEHPHICLLYEFDEVDGQPFLAMQMVEGGTLAETLAHGPLPEIEVVQIVTALGSALSAAHAAGIIHGDVKSGNVLVGNDGALKLADFGVARLALAAGKSGGAPIFGTLEACAPERFRGDEATPESDQFALGVLTYECLTGSLPFDGESAVELVYSLLNATPAAPTRRRPGIAPEWDQVLSRVLAREPGLRFPSVKEMVHAVRAIPSRESVGPGGPIAERVYQLYQRGMRSYAHYTHEDNLRALESFQLAAGEDPGFALAWAGIADSCAQMRDKGWDTAPAWLDRGLAAAERAVTLAPDEPRAHKALGTIHLRRGDYARARAALRRAIDVDARFVPARINLASVLRLEGDLAGCERQLREAVSLDPSEPYAWWALAYSLTFTRRYEEVVKACRRLRRLGASAYFQLRATLLSAAALAYAGDAQGAAHHVEDARRRGLDRVSVAAADALAACAAGEIERARSVIREHEIDVGQNLALYWVLADAAAWVGDARGAVRILSAAERGFKGDMEYASLRLLPGLQRLTDDPALKSWIGERGRVMVWPSEAPSLTDAERRVFESYDEASGRP